MLMIDKGICAIGMVLIFALGMLCGALIVCAETGKFKKKRKCHDNCGQCVFLESVWENDKFKGLHCRKGFW